MHDALSKSSFYSAGILRVAFLNMRWYISSISTSTLLSTMSPVRTRPLRKQLSAYGSPVGFLIARLCHPNQKSMGSQAKHQESISLCRRRAVSITMGVGVWLVHQRTKELHSMNEAAARKTIAFYRPWVYSDAEYYNSL